MRMRIHAGSVYACGQSLKRISQVSSQLACTSVSSFDSTRQLCLTGLASSYDCVVAALAAKSDAAASLSKAYTESQHELRVTSRQAHELQDRLHDCQQSLDTCAFVCFTFNAVMGLGKIYAFVFAARWQPCCKLRWTCSQQLFKTQRLFSACPSQLPVSHRANTHPLQQQCVHLRK